MRGGTIKRQKEARNASMGPTYKRPARFTQPPYHTQNSDPSSSCLFDLTFPSAPHRQLPLLPFPEGLNNHAIRTWDQIHV